MEHTIFKILPLMFYCILSNSVLICQNTNVLNKELLYAFKSKSKSDPFYYNGRVDFGNKVHCYIVLENDLVKNVPIPKDVYCKNNFGIFSYRVNSKGVIDNIRYAGDLDTLIVQKIKYNIAQTQGLYSLPTSISKYKYHWFVLPFFLMERNGIFMNVQMKKS